MSSDDLSIDLKTVEDYLNEVVYKDEFDYCPSDFALAFVTFIKLVNGAEGEENKTPVVHYKMLDTITEGKTRICNLCHRGIAKALSVDSQIITPKGNVRMGDIKVGDELYTRNGSLTAVTYKSEVFNKPMYRIELEDGRKLEVSEDHLNIVLKRLTGKRSKGGFKEHILTTQELLDKGVVYKRKQSDRTPSGYESKWYVPTANLVEYAEKSMPLDPYTIGAILGDGSIDKTSGFTRFHTHADDLTHFLSTLQGACSDSVRSDKRRDSTKRFSLKGIGADVKALIGTENVYNKRIPQEVLWSSSEQRLAVLRGLMDTDGTVYGGSSSYCTVSEGLANDVLWLARSLGFEAKVGKSEGYYRIYIYADVCPFLLERKASKWKNNKKGMVAIKSITPMEDTKSQCIAVADETHSFLAEDFFVTHNTTVMGEYLFLYLAVYGELPGFGAIDLCLYVSDSIENGVKNMRKNLEHRYDNSDFLKAYIPSTRFTDVRWEFNNVDGKKLIVKGYGAKTGVRGAKEMGTRPQLAVLDDLFSDEDAKSPTVIENVEATIYKAVTYALHPDNNIIIWSGTPFNAKDPLYKAVESGAWAVNVFPVCEQFPCSEENFRGSWPDRFTYKYVKEQYDVATKIGRADTFNQELMLRIMSSEDRLILDSDISWYKRSSLLNNIDAYNVYITTDFATGAEKHNDFSVISVWAYSSNGDWYWIDGVVKKQDMSKNINDLFRLAQMYKPQSVGVEVSGQQGGFINWIQDEMMRRRCWFALASENNSNKPGIRPVPTQKKIDRFQVVVPWFKMNRMFFPQERKESAEIQQAMNELTLVSKQGFKSKHDDFSDTISMLSVLSPWKPSAEVSGGFTDGVYEIDDDDHLGNTGMSSYLP